MTSTIEKAINTISIVIGHINKIFLTSTSQEDKEKCAFVNHLLEAQQVALLAYVEDIRQRRQRLNQNKRRNANVIKNFIRNSIRNEIH